MVGIVDDPVALLAAVGLDDEADIIGGEVDARLVALHDGGYFFGEASAEIDGAL